MNLSELRKLDHVRPLSLSEAMRVGAAARPQCFGDNFFDMKSCALGAIIEGSTGEYGLMDVYTPKIVRKQLSSTQVHPVTGEPQWVETIVMNLNDKHQWSREQIADWLESVGF